MLFAPSGIFQVHGTAVLWAKLELCRSVALAVTCTGGACDTDCRVNNSRGDRHCSQCAERLAGSTSELLLPGITYFQVVFTIPDKLSSLALGNRKEVYDLLFRAAWKTLKEVIADEQLFEAAAVMVLHTWNQMLEAHAHLHAMVPGGGPALTGDHRWIKSRRPHVKRCDGKYLCDSEELKSKFRKTFLAGLKRLHANGKLNLTGDWEFLRVKAVFDDWLKPLESVTWVAYIEPPPFGKRPPEMAKYRTISIAASCRMSQIFASRARRPVDSAEVDHTVRGEEFVRAGVCTFFRKVTPRRVASAVTGTVAVKNTWPSVASYWLPLVLNLPRRMSWRSESCGSIAELKPYSPCCPKRQTKMAGLVLNKARLAESS